MIKKYLPKSEFGKNVLTLMTGTTIGQIIPIAISPILARLYSPEDFGFFAVFISITSILSVIASGRFEFAIVIVDDDEKALNLTALGISVAFFLSALTLLLIILFKDPFAKLLDSPGFANFLFLVPIALFFNGTYQTLVQLLNRKRQYPYMSSSKVAQPIAGSSIQIFFGFFKWGNGLILGNIVGILAACGMLWIRAKDYILHIPNLFSYPNLKNTFKEFIDLPKFSLLGSLINSLSFNLGSIFLTIIYNSTYVGYYALIYRVLSTPAMIIGNAVSQVFAEQASVERRNTGFAKHIFMQTTKRMIVLGVPIFLILFFIVDDVFGIVFGEEWREAGHYAQLVLPLFFVRFISSTLSVTMNVFEQWKRSLWVHSSLLMMTLVMFIVAKYFDLSFTAYLIINTAVLSVLYIIFYWYYYNLSYSNRFHKK